MAGQVAAFQLCLRDCSLLLCFHPNLSLPLPFTYTTNRPVSVKFSNYGKSSFQQSANHTKTSSSTSPFLARSVGSVPLGWQTPWQGVHDHQPWAFGQCQAQQCHAGQGWISYCQTVPVLHCMDWIKFILGKESCVGTSEGHATPSAAQGTLGIAIFLHPLGKWGCYCLNLQRVPVRIMDRKCFTLCVLPLNQTLGFMSESVMLVPNRVNDTLQWTQNHSVRFFSVIALTRQWRSTESLKVRGDFSATSQQPSFSHWADSFNSNRYEHDNSLPDGALPPKRKAWHLDILKSNLFRNGESQLTKHIQTSTLPLIRLQENVVHYLSCL